MFTKYELGKFTEEQVLQLAQNAYKKGVSDFSVDPKKCALLVIDMQDEFVKPNWTLDWVPDATKKVPKIKRLIDHCREHNIPVIYTIYSDTHKYLDRPITGKHMPGRYSEVEIDVSGFYKNSKVWHELAPNADEVVIKKCSTEVSMIHL
jgi:isochorismate hydrolase